MARTPPFDADPARNTTLFRIVLHTFDPVQDQSESRGARGGTSAQGGRFAAPRPPRAGRVDRPARVPSRPQRRSGAGLTNSSARPAPARAAPQSPRDDGQLRRIIRRPEARRAPRARRDPRRLSQAPRRLLFALTRCGALNYNTRGTGTCPPPMDRRRGAIYFARA